MQLLSVSELKQFVYCPRIFYYLTVQLLRPPTTGLMERGRRLEEEFARLEPRRVLSRYGFAEARRHFSLPLRDEGLQLAGQLDLLLEDPERLAVVEFKASAAPLAHNHRLQLAAYALLAELCFRKACPSGFVIFLDRKEIEEVELGEDLREGVRGTLAEMREVFAGQECPRPTPVRARCMECEFRNFCGDVF